MSNWRDFLYSTPLSPLPPLRLLLQNAFNPTITESTQAALCCGFLFTELEIGGFSFFSSTLRSHKCFFFLWREFEHITVSVSELQCLCVCNSFTLKCNDCIYVHNGY